MLSYLSLLFVALSLSLPLVDDGDFENGRRRFGGGGYLYLVATTTLNGDACPLYTCQ